MVWWDRRKGRELLPLFLALPVGGVPVFGWLWLRWQPPTWLAGLNRGWGQAFLLATVVLVGTVLLARWPWAETPFDAAVLGLVVGSGAGLIAAVLGWGNGAGVGLAVAAPAVGATVGSLWGLSWVVQRTLLTWLLPAVAWLAAGGLALFLWWFGQQPPQPWPSLAVSACWLVLMLACALAGERRELARQLEEEVRYALVPPWAAAVASQWERRCGRGLSRRWDERKALARLLVRLAACKSYLARRGKKHSTAAVELGKLRERARRLFAPAEVESRALA